MVEFELADRQLGNLGENLMSHTPKFKVKEVMTGSKDPFADAISNLPERTLLRKYIKARKLNQKLKQSDKKRALFRVDNDHLFQLKA